MRTVHPIRYRWLKIQGLAQRLSTINNLFDMRQGNLTVNLKELACIEKAEHFQKTLLSGLCLGCTARKCTVVHLRIILNRVT